MSLIALALNLCNTYDPTPFFITDYKTNKLKVFKTEDKAEMYVHKYYNENVVFIGTMADTTQLHMELVAEILKKVKKK